MSDFYQTGIVTTLHKLGEPILERIEAELEVFSAKRPVALVLPALYSEFECDALALIVEELKRVRYLSQIVVSLARGTDAEFEKAREFFSAIPYDVKILHNEGARAKEVYSTLEQNGLTVGEDGKGRSTWMAYGYIIASGTAGVIAIHDCDIKTYSREMLARLCYPVVNPGIDMVFCKGYYSRVSDRMHGRVTRLLITPLTRALQTVVGASDYLRFLDSFRYPLAGEVCMVTDLARVSRVPWDWGLEVGMLAEVFKNYSTRRVCQVDISDNYEHKHRPLSSDNGRKGLVRMSVDICKNVFRTLASEGVVFSESVFNSLEVAYLKNADEMMERYEADAAINALVYDRSEETMAVKAFSNAIKIAAGLFMEDPMSSPLIPSWGKVSSVIPGVLETLKKAVDEDNA